MRLCFFGDSFTNGTGDDDCLGWVGRVCAAARKSGCDLTWYNLGVRRDTSADILARWRREAEARLPAEYDGRLVFSFGSNDATRDAVTGRLRVEHDQTLANARAILTEARQWRPTLMIGPLPLGDAEQDARIETLSKSLEGLCGELHTPFLALGGFVASIRPTWREEAAAGDGVHPNAASYAHLAQAVVAWEGWRGWIVERSA